MGKNNELQPIGSGVGFETKILPSGTPVTVNTDRKVTNRVEEVLGKLVMSKAAYRALYVVDWVKTKASELKNTIRHHPAETVAIGILACTAIAVASIDETRQSAVEAFSAGRSVASTEISVAQTQIAPTSAKADATTTARADIHLKEERSLVKMKESTTSINLPHKYSPYSDNLPAARINCPHLDIRHSCWLIPKVAQVASTDKIELEGKMLTNGLDYLVVDLGGEINLLVVDSPEKFVTSASNLASKNDSSKNLIPFSNFAIGNRDSQIVGVHYKDDELYPSDSSYSRIAEITTVAKEQLKCARQLMNSLVEVEISYKNTSGQVVATKEGLATMIASSSNAVELITSSDLFAAETGLVASEITFTRPYQGDAFITPTTTIPLSPESDIVATRTAGNVTLISLKEDHYQLARIKPTQAIPLSNKKDITSGRKNVVSYLPAHQDIHAFVATASTTEIDLTNPDAAIRFNLGYPLVSLIGTPIVNINPDGSFSLLGIKTKNNIQHVSTKQIYATVGEIIDIDLSTYSTLSHLNSEQLNINH